MSTESSPLLSGRLSRLSGDAEMAGVAQEEAPLVVGSASGGGSGGGDPARQLSTFFGVIVPTVLSMFSIVVFMRVGRWRPPPPVPSAGGLRTPRPSGSGTDPAGGEGGRQGGGVRSPSRGRSPALTPPPLAPSPGFVVGHAGFLQSLLMLVVAYLIISLTVLSVCAISTNGAVQAGGAYCILWGWGLFSSPPLKGQRLGSWKAADGTALPCLHLPVTG